MLQKVSRKLMRQQPECFTYLGGICYNMCHFHNM